MESTLSLFDYYKILQKRKTAFAIPFFVILVMGILLTMYQPRVYETSVSLLVESSGTVSGTGNVAQENFQTMLTRFLEVAQSPDLIKNVLASMTVKPEVSVILPNLSVRMDRSNPVMRVSLQGTRPKEIAQFLEAYGHHLVMFSENFARDNLNKVLSYIEDQVEVTQKNLQGVESQLKKLQEEQKLLDVASEMSRVLETSKRFKMDLQELESNEGNLKKTIETLRAKIADKRKLDVPPPAQDGMVSNLRNQLITQEMELMSLSSVYSHGHPKITEINEKIAFIQKKIKEESMKIFGGGNTESMEFVRISVDELVRMENQLISMEAKNIFTKQQIDQAEKEFLELSSKKEAFTTLTRRQRIYEQSLATLIDRLNQANIQKHAIQGRISLLSSPYEPVFPVKPNIRLYFSFTFILAFLMGLAMVSLIDQLDNSVKSSEEAQALLGLPIKGLIQDLSTCTSKASSDNLDPLLCTHLTPSSPESETFRTLRTNILYAYKQNPFQTLMLVSPTIGAGKSTVSTNMAIVIAQAGYQVILVDTDLRRPSLHRLFRLDNSKGLTRLLTGTPFEECIQETVVPRLRVLTSGPLPPNPTEILHNEGFGEAINFLKTQADFVVFDNPPIKKLTDSLILATKIQRIFFMVSVGMTDKKETVIAHDLLKGLNCEILGLICNRVPASDLGGYYYYYG